MLKASKEENKRKKDNKKSKERKKINEENVMKMNTAMINAKKKYTMLRTPKKQLGIRK